MGMQLVPYDKQPAGERIIARNLVTVPSFESGPGGAVSVNASLTQSTDWAASGEYSLRITPLSSSFSTALIEFTGLTAGTTYTLGGKVHLDAPQTGALSTYARRFYRVGVSFSYLPGFEAPPNAAGTHEVRATFTATGSSQYVELVNGATQGNGDIFWDDLLIVEGEYRDKFFWKDTPDADPIHYREEADGTATKYEQLYTPVDEDAMPSVEIFIDDIDPEVASVTVRRTAAGRTHEVRGAVNAQVQGALSRIDYETPFGVSSSYRAEFFDAAGDSLGFSDPETITIDSDRTWLHNPLNPAGGVRVQALETASRKLSRPVPGEVSYPIGRRVGVVLTQGRRGLQGEVFDVYMDDLDAADKVQALIGDYETTTVPVICIRTGGWEKRMRIPKPLFLSVFDITEEDADIRLGGTSTLHRMKGDEAAPPAPGLFIPLLTRADVNAYYATRAAANADNATRSSFNRRYDLAGTADQ